MKEDQHPPEATEKRRPTSPEKNRKHAAYAALLKKGLTKSQAAKALGYSTGSIGMLDAAIERKNLISSVSCDSNARIARRAVRLLAQAKIFGCLESVRAADVLRASEIILDRAEPKVQATPDPPRLSFVQINVDVARADLHLGVDVARCNDSDDSQVSEPLDVTPTAGPASTPTGSGVSPPRP